MFLEGALFFGLGNYPSPSGVLNIVREIMLVFGISPSMLLGYLCKILSPYAVSLETEKILASVLVPFFPACVDVP